jgi:hypothetical protein
VLLSNSWTELPLELYKQYHIEKIEARRVVSAKKEGRKKVFEILAW